MYNLTWIEIFRIVEGFKLQNKRREVQESGARRSDFDKFEKFDQRMKEKYQG